MVWTNIASDREHWIITNNTDSNIYFTMALLMRPAPEPPPPDPIFSHDQVMFLVGFMFAALVVLGLWLLAPIREQEGDANE